MEAIEKIKSTGEIPFRAVFHAGWGAMDFNGHMANRAYLDHAGDTRMLFFASQGWSMRDFERLNFGPIVSRDTLDYFREIRLLEKFEVDLKCSGLSKDGSRVMFSNIFYREDGKKAAIVESVIGWLSLSERKLIAPPEELLGLLRQMERAEKYEILN